MADNSSKLVKALFSSNQGEKKSNFDIGKIDPRILKILGIENEFEIEDEQEYLSLLKEKMLLISMGKSKLSREDEELIIEEFKALRSKKFPKKKITADSFRRGTAVGINLGSKKIAGGISPKQLALPPSVDKMSGKSDIQEIIDALSGIIEQLTAFNKLSGDELERDRRARENKRRAEREGELEKGFSGVIKAAEKVIAPVKSILDRIINFLMMILIGRSLVLLLRWFQDPDNKKKVEAIGRFLGDHWPKLLALFIAFGTGLGGFVRGLIGVVVKGTGALIKAAVDLAARAKLKGAGGALKFLGGPKGKLIGKAVQVAAVAGGTVALSKGLENFGGIGGGEKESEPPVQKYSGGGKVKIPAFFGGGLNLSNMMKGASMGAMFGPLGMLLGGALGSGKPQQMVSGFVSGEKGVDKVPAMLTDGEFVMSAGAVRKYGVDTLEAMNAAGGGNNRPKVVSGTTYAWGGGLITDDQLRSQAAAQAAPTGGTEGAREYKFNSNNPDHIRNYETLKKKAISRGVYIDPIDPPQRPPKTSQQSTRTSSPPGGRKPSSTSLMRRPTSALSTNVRPPMQSIRTNMNVPGGFGNLKSLGVEMLANYLMERGFDRINAIVIANKIDEGKKLTGDKRENYIEKLRNIVDREERWQKGFGGVFDSIVGMGKETQSQKLSKSARATLEGIGSSAYTGGGIVGGYGLRDQSFEDAPKTQVMTDEKGRPFVGHKSLQNGKLTYKRGPEPGTGSTNPLEIIGRALFPGAYTVNDARLADKKHKDALVNSLQSFRDRGMGEEGQTKMMKSLGGNIKDTQKDLDTRKAKLSSGGGKSRSGGRGTSSSTARLAKGKTSSKSSGITPPSKPTVKVTTPKSKRQRGAHMKMNKGSASGSTVPKFSASSGSKNRGRNTALYGMGLM